MKNTTDEYLEAVMTRHGLILPVLALALGAGPRPALSQPFGNQVDLSATCDGGTASIQGSITNHLGFDADWLGWIIARTTVGSCTEWVSISAVQAFPDSGLTSELEISDAPGQDRSFAYAVLMVDGDGAFRAPPDSCFAYPNVYYDYVACGSAPVTRGTLWDEGWAFALWVCPDSCWTPMMYIETQWLPEEYHQYVRTDQVLDFYGSVICGTVEGCTMIVTAAQPVAGCEAPVAVERLTWGALRQKYD